MATRAGRGGKAENHGELHGATLAFVGPCTITRLDLSRQQRQKRGPDRDTDKHPKEADLPGPHSRARKWRLWGRNEANPQIDEEIDLDDTGAECCRHETSEKFPDTLRQARHQDARDHAGTPERMHDEHQLQQSAQGDTPGERMTDMFFVQGMDRECCGNQAEVEQDGRSGIGGETSGGVEHPAEKAPPARSA